MKFTRKAARMLAYISVASAVAIAVITLSDVVGRNLGVPIQGAFELIQLLMILLVFSALPSVTLDREHVAVDIVHEALPFRGQRVATALSSLVSFAVFVFFAVQVWGRGDYLALTGEVTYTLNIALYPFVYLVAGFWAVSALCALIVAVAAIRAMFTRGAT